VPVGEHGEDAPMIVVALLQVELQEDPTQLSGDGLSRDVLPVRRPVTR
jgi:hypothetical protein